MISQTYLAYAAFTLVSILLLIKLFEVSSQVIFTCYYHSKLNSLTVDSVSNLRAEPVTNQVEGELGTLRHDGDLKSTRPYAKQAWPVTARLHRSRVPGARFVAHKLFRYRYLMISESAFLVCSTEPGVLFFGIGLIALGIWIEIARLLCDRLVLGRIDNSFRGGLGRMLLPDAYPELLSTAKLTQVRHFVRLFVQVLAITALGYAAIYCAVDKLAGPSGAFSGVPHDSYRFLHFIYFSITTAATVGYGDIAPITLTSRILIATQVVATFFIVVVFATSVALTADGD